MEKRGLSNVVTTTLVILLSIAATGVIYSIVKPAVTGSGKEFSLQQKCLLADVKPISCIGITSNVTLNVQLLKGDVKDIIGVVEFEDGSTNMTRVSAPDILTTKEIIINKQTSQIPKIGSASAVVEDEEGNTRVCEQQFSMNCKYSDIHSSSEQPICPDVCSSSNDILWFHSSETDNNSNIIDLANTNFITHVVISNLDYNYEPIPRASVLAKLNETKQQGLIPIWERDLWFRRWDIDPRNFTQQFINNYSNGTIIFSADYYAWFLQRLKEEADSYNVTLVAIDTESYYRENNLSNILSRNQPLENFTRMKNAVDDAINRTGIKQADYLYNAGPSPWVNRSSGYMALRELGKNKITETTYYDCVSNLNWSLNVDFQLIGIWVSSNNSCYREGPSCSLPAYGKTCPASVRTNNASLWGVDSIFNNKMYWEDVGRGLFIYTNENDQFSVPKLLVDYCSACDS